MNHANDGNARSCGTGSGCNHVDVRGASARRRYRHHWHRRFAFSQPLAALHRDRQRLFTAANVKVDLIYIPASANAIQQLAAGSLDMSFSTGLVDPIRAAEQGAGLAIARFEIQAPPYALIAKSSIKSLKDLKGKVISVGGPKDITRLYVDRMLAPNGLKTGDYDYVYAGATTARAQALLSGAVDAAILLPPSNFQLQNQGFNDLGLTIEYAPELAFSGTMANKAWAARNPDVLKRV